MKLVLLTVTFCGMLVGQTLAKNVQVGVLNCAGRVTADNVPDFPSPPVV
jgi:hypothetical protein